MMNKKLTIFTCLLMVSAFLLRPSASGQTAPTATTTFTEVSGSAWTTGANWDVQVPLGSDDALIGANTTAAWSQVANGDPAFGTLTLGTNATLQYAALSNQGLPSGAIVYFNDGSHLEYTAGTVNRGATCYIVPGASAQITFKDNSIPTYTYSGGGDLLHIVLEGVLHSRNDATDFTGELRYSSNNGSARVLNVASQGGSAKFGPGLTTIENAILVSLGSANMMHDSATVTLVGGTGGSSSSKLNVSTTTDTISNLIIDSPTGSADTFERGANGVLTVADTVTFQGTAANITLNDTQATPSGSGLVAANMTFAGTGAWNLGGDCGIGISGGTLSNALDVTISGAVTPIGGFTKAGLGTLTLADGSGLGGAMIINNGDIIVNTSVTFSGGDYVSPLGRTASFTANYGGSFADYAAVSAAVGTLGNFRPAGRVKDNGASFTVLSPATGTVLILY